MGFVEFLFETKKGKTIMGLIYGWGGAIVIIGALFKIMHWPGSSAFLIAGLGIEAAIFGISAFEPAHMDLDWTLAYPELAGMDEGHDQNKVNNGSATEQLDTMLDDAKIGPELIESLGEGLRSLSSNANKLSDISDASVATSEYTESLKSASTKVGELANDYSKASESLAVLNEAANSGANTGEEMQKMASTLEKLNESYSSQLNGSQQQAETMQAMYSGITELLTNLSDSVEDTKKYKENISELSTNLSALNNVYGNVLTAMKS
ncbi:MAG: gliding motility protein GldL [Vicingaceae bacterium]